MAQPLAQGCRDTTYCVDELPDYLRNVQYVITLMTPVCPGMPTTDRHPDASPTVQY